MSHQSGGFGVMRRDSTARYTYSIPLIVLTLSHVIHARKEMLGAFCIRCRLTDKSQTLRSVEG